MSFLIIWLYLPKCQAAAVLLQYFTESFRFISYFFLRLDMETVGGFSPWRAAILAISQPETAGLPAIQKELKGFSVIKKSTLALPDLTLFRIRWTELTLGLFSLILKRALSCRKDTRPDLKLWDWYTVLSDWLLWIIDNWMLFQLLNSLMILLNTHVLNYI